MKAITTRYLGPTNTKGSRVKATDNDGHSITISYNSGLRSEEAHAEAAIALCRKLGWHGHLAAGALKEGYAFVWAAPSLDTFVV